MEAVSDILLAAGALGAGFYCWILSQRLRRFTDLEKGVGGAIAVLSMQVDELTAMIRQAQSAAEASADKLGQTSARAETAARRLELLMASMHDIPDPGGEPSAPDEFSPFFSHDQEARS